MSTPPPLPAPDAAPSTARREITRPLAVGEDFDVYRVAVATPDLLRLKVNTGFYLVAAVVCAVASVGFFWTWKTFARHETVYDNDGRALTGAIIAAILAVGSVLNLGRSMEIDRAAGVLRKTRFFFFTKEHALADVREVRIEIEPPRAVSSSPSNQGEHPTASAASAAPEPANKATLSLIMNGRPLSLNLADSNLHAASAWPTFAAGALHVSRLLRLPLRIEGAVDQAPDSVREDVRQLRAATPS